MDISDQKKQNPEIHNKLSIVLSIATLKYFCVKRTIDKQTLTALRATERKILDLKLQDKVPCSAITKRTKIFDII